MLNKIDANIWRCILSNVFIRHFTIIQCIRLGVGE